MTPGVLDTRSPDRIGFPPSLAGRRCLDVATFDGFWAFEMSRRSAEEVLAIHIVDPRGWYGAVTPSRRRLTSVRATLMEREAGPSAYRGEARLHGQPPVTGVPGQRPCRGRSGGWSE